MEMSYGALSALWDIRRESEWLHNLRFGTPRKPKSKKPKNPLRMSDRKKRKAKDRCAYRLDNGAQCKRKAAMDKTVFGDTAIWYKVRVCRQHFYAPC